MGSSGQATTVRAGEGETLDVLGTTLRFLCLPEQTRKAWSLMEAELPLGAGPPAHHHPWDEAYYVVAGEIDFELAGEKRRVRAGDFVYAPAGTVHAFQGASSQGPARLLVFDAPGHAAQFFRDLDAEVKRIPEDLPKVPRIGDRHQVHFLR